MKHLIVFAFSLFLTGAAGLAFAQNKPAASTGAAKVTTSSGNQSVQNPNAHEINALLKTRKKQLHADLKSGKLTKDQAKAEWEKLKTARRQQLDFMRRNGQKEITAEQKNQLKAMMGQNTGSN